MTLIKKEYEINAVFLRQPWKPLTFSEIQKMSGKKSKSYSYSALGRLEEEELIAPDRIGKRALVYRARLDSSFAQNYWGFLHEYISRTTSEVPLQLIENLRAKMPTAFFVMLITGSYARKKRTEKSDLDVVIICNGETDKKRIYQELTHISEISIPPVHLYVFTKSEFLEMLLNEKENYGKETARNCLVFFGGAIYYSILNEAIKHGFRG
jgi:predicted nucleotidyltransferase